MVNNVKSCGMHFLHQHVATETAAAAQYVVHEQVASADTEQCLWQNVIVPPPQHVERQTLRDRTVICCV